MFSQANIVLSHGRHRGIDSYVDYLLDLLHSLYASVTIGDAYRADAHNYLIDGNIPNESDEIRILAAAGVIIIFVATEWTKFFRDVLYLDTFHYRDLIASFWLRSLPKRYRGLLTNPLFAKVLNHSFDIQIDLLYFYVNRAEEFRKNCYFFTAIIAPCQDLIEPYKHFGIPIFAIEPFFNNINPLRSNLESSPKIFFSGKFTKYRQVVLANMQKVHSNLDIQYIENSSNLSKGIFTHELYIPQQGKWPYGSPIRTYRSYRQGFIPVNFAHYDQNTINSYLPILSDSPESYDTFMSYKIEKLMTGANASNAIREEQIKTYRDYLIQQEKPSQKRYYASTIMQGIQIVAEGYQGFNLLKLEEKYYAIPQGEGDFNLQRFEKKNYSVSFIGKSKADICRQIAEYKPLLPAQIKEIRKAYKGFNILELNQKYYGIPEGEGEFSLQRFEKKNYSVSFIGKSKADVCRQIAEYKPLLSAQIKEIRKAYKGFNILELNQKYYGIPEGEGEFTLQRFEKQDYSNSFIGESEAIVCRQIKTYKTESAQYKELYTSNIRQGLQMVAEGYQGFNILELEGKYYAIPQGEGEFSLQRFENQDYSASFIDESEIAVCRQITKQTPTELINCNSASIN